MGIEFKPYDPVTPDGHYETLEINNMNALFIHGDIGFYEWWTRLARYSETMIELRRPWGMKDPKFSYPCILGGLIGYFGNVWFVRCSRTREQTVESIVRSFGTPESEANYLYTFWNIFIDRLLEHRKVVFMEMSERASDENIMQRLSVIGNG